MVCQQARQWLLGINGNGGRQGGLPEEAIGLQSG